MGQKQNSSLGCDCGKFCCATCRQCWGGDFAGANPRSQHVVITVCRALCCLVCTKQVLITAGGRMEQGISQHVSDCLLGNFVTLEVGLCWSGTGGFLATLEPHIEGRESTDGDHQLQAAHERGRELRTAECFNSGCIFYSVRSENLIAGLHPVMLSKVFISLS